MTEKEKKDYDAFYKSVRQLMGYSEKQPLTNTQALRLKGLNSGRYIENSNIKSYGEIGYDILLLTLKMYYGQITTGLSKNTFKDSNHKFNYICKIIESHVNDVYIAVQNKKNAEKINERTVSEYLTETNSARGTEKYKEIHKEKTTTNEDLWGDM